MDIAEISDRMELEKLVTDYATAVDTKNFKEFNNLFTKDAHIDYTAVGGIAGNLQEIIKYLETALDRFPNYQHLICLLYTSPSPRDQRGSRMPSSA